MVYSSLTIKGDKLIDIAQLQTRLLFLMRQLVPSVSSSSSSWVLQCGKW